MKTGPCYWRYKGEKAYRYGFATLANCGLYRMGLWYGDMNHGPYVDPVEIEIR